MKKTLHSMWIVLVCLSFNAKAQNYFFTKETESFLRSSVLKPSVKPEKYETLTLDTLQLKSFLKKVPAGLDPKRSPFIISLPMANGTVTRYSITETSVLPENLAAQFPEIRTFTGQGIDDRSATLKMDWTTQGFHAQVLSAASGAAYIEPYALGNKTDYISYFAKDLKLKRFKELNINDTSGTQTADKVTAGGMCYGTQLRKYRMAIACSGEYAIAVAGTNPTKANVLSAMTTSLNSINGIYEQEAAITFVFATTELNVIFLDPATSPIYGYDNHYVLSYQSNPVIDTYAGVTNYDIGHVFTTSSSSWGGNGPCDVGHKASGVTGDGTPVGVGFIRIVAHEMGHQFSASHTYNGIQGGCTGNTPGTTNVEPGSGSTLMSYCGICGSDDLQGLADFQFHAISQNQIATYSITGSANSCPVTTATNNTPPVVNAGANYKIPVSTPFVLKGSATDVNNDMLTYSWEEMDPGTTVGSPSASATAPLFRSFAPVYTGTRYFPKLSALTGTLSYGENLPISARVLNFRLTVRDNHAGGAGACSGDITVTTVAGTPFTVTSQSTTTNWTANGTNTATITWNVAGTNAAPFSTANVDILFSADGGLTYPYTLLTATANDGSQVITIPSITTSNGRIMVRANGHIFFNINAAPIIIKSSCAAEAAFFSPATTVTATAGTAPLNLSLNPQFATLGTFAPTGSLTTSDNQMRFTYYYIPGSGCNTFSNQCYYDSYAFTVNVSGNYTFTRTAGASGTTFNFYSTALDPTSGCTNFLVSNTTFDGSSIDNSTNAKTLSLTAGNTYVLNVTTGYYTPTLPYAYAFAVTAAPTGGIVYNGISPYPNPGASFTYGYVIVNSLTNTIVGISSTPNLTNSSTYPQGTFNVYGISYANSIAASVAGYVGQNFNNLTAAIAGNPAGFCANISKNAVSVNIVKLVPVTMLALNATKGNKKTLLTWSTATEQNTDYFLVEGSSDGISFTKQIGRVTAAHFSSTLQNYNAADIAPVTGWNYYRVKQVDADGNFSYSNIASVKFDGSGLAANIYPNPASDKLNLELAIDKAGQLMLEIIDSKGAVVQKQTNNVLQGINIIQINIPVLSKGGYILKYYRKESGASEHIKFIKR